jgi:glutamate/tyrosine decarboxylase-like PLP-dependent enzyme
MDDRPMDELPMDDLLRRTTDAALDWFRSLPDRRVGPAEDADVISERLRVPLPEAGEDPWAVVDRMRREVEPGLVASAGPRYFGFVIGGAEPASVAADWLTAAWDQNANGLVMSPAASAAERVAGEWMLELLGLPAEASTGLSTGAGLANAVGLAAGRHAVLQRAGWDVEARGLYGAPEIEVIAGEEAHATIDTSLAYLGLGRERVTRIPADDQGAMRPDAVASAVAAAAGRPVLVCAQAGNVNTGAFDPFGAIADAVAAHGNAWMHVDGAFGLWAGAVPRLRHLVAGVERADSWATDAHKWLNVGYDCGFVAVRDREAHERAMAARAAYLMSDHADPGNRVLDSSRRARGFVLYATLRSLGRDGVRELVDRCCRLASRMADRLAAEPGVSVLNDVQLNQVLVRFGDDDEHTRAVVAAVQAEGTAWMGGTVWHGLAAMRISVSNWMTTETDIDRTADAILAAHRGAATGPS